MNIEKIRDKLLPKTSKKGQIFGELSSMALGLVALGITLVVVLLIMSQVKSNSTVSADGNATNAIKRVTEGAEDVSDWLSIVVITVIGALLLGLIVMFGRGVMQKR